PTPTNKHPQAPVQTLNGEQDNLLTGVCSSYAPHAPQAPIASRRAKPQTVLISGTGHLLKGRSTTPHRFAQAPERAEGRADGAAR
ncbi:hypothetical protein, partial [Nonomuraea ceibae]|uniref:hypothetical protein n=1 Tax=Nonomuraea ceibae TaxID=1935170 RepID=UPI001C5FA644